MSNCTCCEKSPVHPLCGDHCEQCHRPCCCAVCDNELDSDLVEDWKAGEPTEIYCEACEASNKKYIWIDETCSRVEELASLHGWEHGDWSTAETGSRYTELSRECSSCLGVVDRECECKTLKVRVSDHGSAYCSEDLSIALNPSGDDHTIKDLERRLAGETKND